MSFRSMTSGHAQRSCAVAILAGLALTAAAWSFMSQRETAQSASFIVAASEGGASAARRAVEAIGGHVTAELPIIDAVTAQLTGRQRQRLAKLTEIRSVFADAPVELKSDRANVRDN